MTLRFRCIWPCAAGLLVGSPAYPGRSAPPPLPDLPPTGPYLARALPNAITVCWVSSGEEQGEVLYRLDVPRKGGSGFVHVREKRPARVHRVTITGLQPYTRYVYAVVGPGRRTEGSFRTAPLPGGSFRFVAYGDTRSQPERHAEVLASFLKFQPDFALQTGDLVEQSSKLSEWAEFFQVAGNMLRQVPYYPALGNHELGRSPYFQYFPSPRDYSFDYGCAHFVILDSNRPPNEWKLQEVWLREDLARNQQAKWRIVALHHTLFTASPGRMRRADSIRLFRRLIGILHAGHVALVISGHEHNYEHFFSRGIHYVVTGGGGAPLVPPVPNAPFAVLVKKAHHHCQLTVTPQQISVRAVEPNGTEIERFDIGSP